MANMPFKAAPAAQQEGLVPDQLGSNNSLTLRTNISNLANKEYWLSSYYLGAPRTLTFSAQLEF